MLRSREPKISGVRTLIARPRRSAVGGSKISGCHRLHRGGGFRRGQWGVVVRRRGSDRRQRGRRGLPHGQRRPGGRRDRAGRLDIPAGPTAPLASASTSSSPAHRTRAGRYNHRRGAVAIHTHSFRQLRCAAVLRVLVAVRLCCGSPARSTPAYHFPHCSKDVDGGPLCATLGGSDLTPTLRDAG